MLYIEKEGEEGDVDYEAISHRLRQDVVRVISMATYGLS